MFVAFLDQSANKKGFLFFAKLEVLYFSDFLTVKDSISNMSAFCAVSLCMHLT